MCQLEMTFNVYYTCDGPDPLRCVRQTEAPLNSGRFGTPRHATRREVGATCLQKAELCS